MFSFEASLRISETLLKFIKSSVFLSIEMLTQLNMYCFLYNENEIAYNF